jgi:hypothetical protein
MRSVLYSTILRNGFFSGLLLLIIILTSLCQNLSAAGVDSTLRKTAISAAYYRGLVYPHHEYIQFHNHEYINGVDFRLGRTFPEINSRRIPTIGFGGYMSNLGNSEIFGNVYSGYVYFASPIVKLKEFTLGTNVSSGLGWITKPNEPSLNPLNQAIGSHLNAFIVLALDFRFWASNNFSVFLGPTLTHNSNGKIKRPNTGLNIFSLKMGAEYIIKSNKAVPSQIVADPNTNDRHRINFLFSGGIQEDSKQKPIAEGVWGLNTNYSYFLGKNGRAGAGIDMFYIPTEYKYYTENEVVLNPSPWSGGVYLGYEIVWERLSFVLQHGLRLFYENPYESDFYSRVGIRYRFAQRYVVNCSLKTSKLVAEYIEWGIGYDLNL